MTLVPIGNQNHYFAKICISTHLIQVGSRQGEQIPRKESRMTKVSVEIRITRIPTDGIIRSKHCLLLPPKGIRMILLQFIFKLFGFRLKSKFEKIKERRPKVNFLMPFSFSMRLRSLMLLSHFSLPPSLLFAAFSQCNFVLSTKSFDIATSPNLRMCPLNVSR